MRLEQLQAFISVAETGNFQQAGHRCGVTQSTISRQIQSLESDLGVLLFHRQAQNKLTIAGERFLPYARKICLTWASATQELGDLLAGKQPELCVAAIHSVCATYLPPVLQHFCRDFPDVQLRVTALGSDRALKVLKDGLVDVAIVMHNRFLTTSAEMVVNLLYSESIEILMAADHPLAMYESVPWSQLILYPQVVFKDGYGMQRLVQEQFDRRGATLKAVLELNALDAFRSVVRQGDIIALLPHSALIEVEHDPGLAIRAIQSTPINPHLLPSGIKYDGNLDSSWMRQVALVTTVDRLQLPPIAHFCQLVEKLISPKNSHPHKLYGN